MASRRLYDGAQIELGILPIVAPVPPPSGATKIWLNVSGVWKECVVWLNVSGTWKIVTPYLNVGGTWK
jgi:hypothetical protein